MKRAILLSAVCSFIILVTFYGCSEPFPNNKIRFDRNGIYIPLDWYVIGPFRDTNKYICKNTFLVEDLKQFGVNEAGFNMHDLETLALAGVSIRKINDKYLIADFRNLVDTFHRKSNLYLFTTVESRKIQEAYLMVDGAAAYRIWVNNEEIYSERNKRSMRMMCDRFIKVNLKRGENHIFAKVNREFNFNAWGINIVFAREQRAKEIYRANFYRSFVANPVAIDSMFFYAGPFEITKAEILGDGLQKELPINESPHEVFCGFLDVSSLKQGFYNISLFSETDTFTQLVFTGNLRQYYDSLVAGIDIYAINDDLKKEHSLLLDRINSLYARYDSSTWRTRKSTNTNLVYWVKQLETFIYDHPRYVNNLALKNYTPPGSDSSYTYAFFLDSALMKNSSVPLIVVIPFEITENNFAESWYMSNFEQLWVDAKLAREMGFALCYLHGKGPDYSINGMKDEFINVMEAIEKEFPMVETGKVFLTGVCEGAGHALILANSLPGRVKAIGVKTPLPGYSGIVLDNLRGFPIIVTHGKFDHIVGAVQMQEYVSYLSTKSNEVKYLELNEGHESFSKDDRKPIFEFFLRHR